MHASQQLQLDLAYKIWVEDPPASSYPACIAVKCAAFQSPTTGRLFLHHLRQAVMVHGKNIAKQEVLQEVATSVAAITNDFSVTRFLQDMQNDRGLDAFRNDLQEVKYRNINRFPTLLIERSWAPGLVVTGFRPAEILLQIINEPIHS
jgi:predicted DsbA family dithiol-disulfide isomerase